MRVLAAVYHDSMHRAWVAGLAFLGAGTFSAGTGATEGGAEAEVRARTARIEAALAAGEDDARLWWNGWLIGFGVATVGEATIAVVTKNDRQRASTAVGAVESGLGVLGVLFSSRAAFTGRETIASMDASTPEARREKLRIAEKLLDDAADEQALGRSPLAHLGAIVVNVTGTSILWWRYHQYFDGWLNLVVGTVASEAQILTHPTAALRARRAVSMRVVPTFGGVAIEGSF
jgi:hypothetical protein